MSGSSDSHGLPFLPGYTFRDVTKSAFHRPQTLSYKNGYALPQRPTVGIGQDPLLSQQLNQQELDDLLAFEREDVSDSRDSLYEEFIPTYVVLDKKVLCYHAYFTEHVDYSPAEVYRVRPVIIYYYLEDDSMCIIEPRVRNSGIPQGTRLKRHRLPKNERGDFYLWKDLNLGMDLEVYGFKYHITQCDAFTKEFMESEGLVVNDPEPMPEDPYITRRKVPENSHTTPSDFDSKHQFLTMDKKVLHFHAMWDDLGSLFGEVRPVGIHYYLVDDTVEVREVHERNSGRDPFPVLMRRQRLPKAFKPQCDTFPSCVLEVTAQEVDQYYSPKDFQLGQTVKLLGRSFLLYDCDGFTKEYYQKNYPNMEMKPVEPPKKTEVLKKSKVPREIEVPPYNGYGTLEDSMRNCFHLCPVRPVANVVKALENSDVVLRYSARLDSWHAGDDLRRFIIYYYVSSGMLAIFETPTSNSGIIGGKFLEKVRIPKPGFPVENPVYYSPADFAIGATVEVFSHRFVITDADRFVLTYLESIASQIPCQTLDCFRQRFGVEVASEQQTEQNGDAVEEPSS